MIYGLKENNIKSIQSVFEKFQEIDQAILYGSRAKGNFQPSSDIDITLKGENLNLTTINKIEQLLDDLLLPYRFDISVYHQISNVDLIEHISRVGKVIYRK